MEKLGGIAIMISAAIIFIAAGVAMILHPSILSIFPAFLRGYMAVHLPYAAAFIAIAAGARLIHLSASGLLSQRIRPKSMIIAASLYALLLAFSDLAYIRSISASGVAAGVFIAELIPVIILTPMQATAEELFFRAIPLRIAYGEKGPADMLRALPFIVFSGIFFLLPHLGNREVDAASSALFPIIYYFSWGALAAFLGIASGGFEAVAAMHAVNNMHIALIVNYESSSMMTEALFLNSRLPSDALSIIALYIAFALIYLALERAGCIKEGFRIHG